MKLRVQIENESYEVEVGDLTQRPILVVVDGETFEIFPEELHSAPAVVPAAAPSQVRARQTTPAGTPVPASDRIPSTTTSQTASGTLTAPIPGVILSIAVKLGDAVESGQEICILEAMKMKNTIRANRAGKITAVHISSGDTVTHGQPLVDF